MSEDPLHSLLRKIPFCPVRWTESHFNQAAVGIYTRCIFSMFNPCVARSVFWNIFHILNHARYCATMSTGSQFQQSFLLENTMVPTDHFFFYLCLNTMSSFAVIKYWDYFLRFENLNWRKERKGPVQLYSSLMPNNSRSLKLNIQTNLFEQYNMLFTRSHKQFNILFTQMEPENDILCGTQRLVLLKLFMPAVNIRFSGCRFNSHFWTGAQWKNGIMPRLLHGDNRFSQFKNDTRSTL